MSNKLFWRMTFLLCISLLITVILAGCDFGQGENGLNQVPKEALIDQEPFFKLRLYLPSSQGLLLEEVKIVKRTDSIAIAEAVMQEFFSHSGREEYRDIPVGVRLIGLYQDEDGILYMNLSDELRRNFQGGALEEYLLLEGMRESLVSNVDEFRDFKILIEGKEVESIGGHYYLQFPLSYILRYSYRGDIGVALNE